MLKDARCIYVLWDPVGLTHQIGGGSSTPARERFYATFEQAKKIRDRYFKRCLIQEYELVTIDCEDN